LGGSWWDPKEEKIDCQETDNAAEMAVENSRPRMLLWPALYPAHSPLYVPNAGLKENSQLELT